MKLPGVAIVAGEGGLARVGGSVGTIAVIGTGTKLKGQVNSVVSVKDAEKFGDGSVQRACKRIFEMSGASVIAYVLPSAGSVATYSAGIDAVLAWNTVLECIAIVDSTAKDVWEVLADKAQNATKSHRYVYGVAQTRGKVTGNSDASKNEKDVQFASKLVEPAERGQKKSNRLVICAGTIMVRGSDGVPSGHPIIDTVLGSIARRDAHEGIDAVKWGSLAGATDVGEAWDETTLENLLNAGYTTVRRFYGRAGVYITLARLATDDTSDYDTLEKIRVMNRASNAVRGVQIEFVNGNIPANAGGVAFIKKESEVPLEVMKSNGEITDFSVSVDTSKLISERLVKTAVAIVPLGKTSRIETEITYKAGV